MALQLNGTTGISPSALPYLVGQVCFFATQSAPAGFLVCDGSEVSRVAYADAYAVMGTLYGAGNGSTTFNLPDLRGEFIRGADIGRGVDPGRTVGSVQGHQSNNLAQVQMSVRSDLSADLTLTDDGAWTAWLNSGEEGAFENFAARFRLHGRETRPRNVALLPCVFVGV